MKFSVPTKQFQKALAQVLPAIPPKATIEVLEHINLLIEEENELKIVASDQEMMIMSKIKVENSEIGAVLVPAKRINDVVRELSGIGSIELSVEPETFNIALKTDSGHFDMKGIDPDEYLDLPELFENEKPIDVAEGAEGTIDTGFKTVKFEEEEMSFLAEKAIVSISKEDYRPQMTGMCLEFKESLINAVSTDSYRLTRAGIEVNRPDYPSETSVIIPYKAVEYLKKHESAVDMSFLLKGDEISHLKFDYGDLIFITNVITDSFPPYESVIPSDNHVTMFVNRDDMIAAVRRILLFANTRTRQIVMSITSDRVVVKAEDMEVDSRGEEVIVCECNHAPLDVCFNGSYLLDSLHNIDDAPEGEETLVTFAFSDPDKAVLLFPKNDSRSDYKHLLMLLMPVRLSQKKQEEDPEE